jgi:hypothetical protein
MPKLEEELARLLERMPADDLKDLVAMHGAGKLGRQVKVRAKHWIAGNWATAIFGPIHPMLAAVLALIAAPFVWFVVMLILVATGFIHA